MSLSFHVYVQQRKKNIERKTNETKRKEKKQNRTEQQRGDE